MSRLFFLVVVVVLVVEEHSGVTGTVLGGEGGCQLPASIYCARVCLFHDFD